MMATRLDSDRGFSITDLLMAVAILAIVGGIATPIMTNLTEGQRLASSARELERELQTARLKAVSSNRPLRVRLNCPVAGQYRIVEVTADIRDGQDNRCDETAFPYPADTDLDPVTRPNHDGPLRRTKEGVTVSSVILEFRPDGTTRQVVSGTPQVITTPVSIAVTRADASKMVTVNGYGKIQLQ